MDEENIVNMDMKKKILATIEVVDLEAIEEADTDQAGEEDVAVEKEDHTEEFRKK